MRAAFDRRWADLEPIGRVASGGYRRFAWTRDDATLREWFAGEADRLGLDLVLDRAGNQWAWWGDPDSGSGMPGVVTGSHLDSVPDGGAFDGPLGVVSALTAIEALQASGFEPARPIAVVNFADEEGARFGVACAGSRVITGALDADRARALTDADGTSIAEAMRAGGLRPEHLGQDDETLRRIGAFVELHVEQGRYLGPGQPVGVASEIWPHGRWRFDFAGEANHAGTTRLEDRHDAMLGYAQAVLAARELAAAHGCVATFGKVRAVPNGVNAVPSLVQGWLDARGPQEASVKAVVAGLSRAPGLTVTTESWTGATAFDPALSDQVAAAAATALGAPGELLSMPTGAGHDAGVLASAGIPAAMLFVRNPTGVSHSPHEFAEPADCHAGVVALTGVLRELTGART